MYGCFFVLFLFFIFIFSGIGRLTMKSWSCNCGEKTGFLESSEETVSYSVLGGWLRLW